MRPTEQKNLLQALLAFCAAGIGALFIYRLGLPGDFIFDDYPNLELLGKNGGVHDLTTLRLYLGDSFAGPTGRPISMLSFLWDARDWPADPAAFKSTNILLHITNGSLLFWALSLALPQARVLRKASHALWIASISAAWWMLSPYLVSTVLYTVQRMAELSTTFVLIGIISYLLGRRRLQNSPRGGYIFLSVTIPLTTLAAVLSKENGALLPCLLLVVEFVLLARASDSRPDSRWLAIFLLLPSAILVTLLLSKGLAYDANTIAIRGFTMVQRLLTESRVLMEYLWYLLIPQPGTPGLFRDNIALSTSLTAPLSTLFSVLGICLLSVFGILARKRLPLASAAILFFFAGHLMESTVLPLEIAFEHRNYLPSLLLYLPLAQLLVLAHGHLPTGSTAIGLLLFVLLGAILAARTTLWADRSMLYHMWAVRSPDSVRAQLSYTNILENSGHPHQSLDFLTHASQRLPHSLLLKIHLLRMHARSRPVDQSTDLEDVLTLARTAPFSHEAVVAAMALTDDVISGKNTHLPAKDALRLWQALSSNKNVAFQRFTGIQFLHQQGRLYLLSGNITEATRFFSKALTGSRTAETGLRQSAILASNRYFCAALHHLDETARVLEKQPLTVSRAVYYRGEIEHLRETINNNIPPGTAECTPASLQQAPAVGSLPATASPNE